MSDFLSNLARRSAGLPLLIPVRPVTALSGPLLADPAAVGSNPGEAVERVVGPHPERLAASHQPAVTIQRSPVTVPTPGTLATAGAAAPQHTSVAPATQGGTVVPRLGENDAPPARSMPIPLHTELVSSATEPHETSASATATHPATVLVPVPDVGFISRNDSFERNSSLDQQGDTEVSAPRGTEPERENARTPAPEMRPVGAVVAPLPGPLPVKASPRVLRGHTVTPQPAAATPAIAAPDLPRPPLSPWAAVPLESERARRPARDSRVEIHIGSIEIRPETVPLPSPPAATPVTASQGFEAFSRLRRYASWNG